MLTTAQRIRTYTGIIILAVILTAAVFGFSAYQRLADIRTLNEVRSFSYALERFKQDHWRYPSATTIDIRQGVLLTERGFQPGSKVYYQGGIPSRGAAIYQSDGKEYLILFRLQRSWPELGIADTKCQVGTNYALTCGS